MSNQDMQLKVTLTADGRHLSGSLKTAAGEVREFGATTDQASSQAAKSLSKTRKGVESISTQLEQMRSHATRAVGVLAGMAGVNFTVQGFTQAIAEAKGLRGAMNEVATLLDDTSGLEQYRANVVQMGKAYGDTQKQANALYQIVSAGHGGMADSARILEQANKLALGGVTDVFVATDGLTTALNAYEYSAAEAETVSDKFFIAMKGGKTSINEIASSIGQVAPLASNAGVALDQLLSASAALTTSGLSTSESMTQLKSIISGLLAPTAQARTHAAELGLEFDLAALKTKGLSGFLADLAEKTNGSAESVAQLFGSVEAQAAVLSLTGAQASKFSEILANMGDSANATNEAVDLLSQGAEFALDGIGMSLAALRLDAGEIFLEALAPSLIYINENFDDLIDTTAFLTKTTLALFAAYKLGPPLMAAVTKHTTAMAASQQIYTARTIAATAATHAARLAMLALPHVALAAGIATVVYAFTQYNNQQKETARLANEARASIAAYNAEQNSVEGLQARLKAEEEALAAAQATAAAHEAGTSQAAQSLEKLRSMIESGNFSGDTLAGLVQNYEKLQASIESATAKAEGSKQRIADLKEALAALGVQTDDTAAKLNSLGQTGEQSDAIEKLTAALVDQYTKLALGERAYLDYQLVQQSATATQREQALAAYDSIEALKAQEAAQANYASTLSKSASDSIKSLSDVEKQSQRVWSALASGKISTTQAAAAIDGLAAAGAGLVNEQQQWIDQMIAAMDPARALQEEITALQETFEDGLFGDLSEDKFNDYIDSLKKKLAELNDVKIQDPAVQMGSAMQTAAGGIKDVAGAMQGMYSEGERGYQNMAVAMQAANVLAAVGAVLQQGNANPWTAFANMAAMAAAVASLGYSVGSMGGGFEDTAAIRQAEQGTGTVLGDSAAKSESIAKAVDITAVATSQLVGINKDMLRALQTMQAGISGASVRIAQGAKNVDFGTIKTPKNAFNYISDLGSKAIDMDIGLKVIDTLSFGLLDGAFKAVGKLLGGSSKVTDEGIQIVGGTLAELIDDVTVEAYQTVKSKKYKWSSSKKKTSFEELDDEVSNQFALVFDSLAESVYQGATVLGLSADAVENQINDFNIATEKISFKGLDAEKQQAEIEAVFSTIFDNLASSVVDFLPKFQKAGEGLGETLVRVATNVQVAEEAVFRLGFAAENINPEQFASLSVYLIDATGGLEQFIGAMSGFVDKFAPESRKLELLTADMTRALSEVGLSVPATRDEMWQLMQALDATTEAGADQIATLLRLTDTAESYYKTLEAAANFNRSVQQQLDRIRLSGQDLALYNLDSEFDQLRKEAAKVGGDLANIEKLYGQKRAAVLAEFAEQIEGDQQQSSAAAQNASHALRQSAMAQEERNRLLEEERKQLEAISGINLGFARLGTTFEGVMSDAVGNFLDKVQIDLASAGGAEGILDAGAGQLVINLEKARKAITDVTNWEHQLSGASGRSATLAAERKEATDKWWDDYKDLSDNARHLDNMMSSGAHSVSSYLERIISGGPSNEKLFKRIVDQLGGFGEIQALYREWQDDDTSYTFSSWLPQVGHDYVTAIIGSTESIDAAYDQAIGDISSGNYASRLQERIAEALAPFDAGSLKDLTKIEWETVDAIREVEAGFGGLNTILNESGEINADLAAAIKAAIDNVEQIEKVFRDSFQESFAGAMGVELDSIGSAFDEVAKKYSEAAFSQQERLSIELRAHQQRVMQFGDLGITADISISKFRELFEAAQGVVDGETLGRWWAAADAMSDMSNTLDKISNLDPSLTADPRLGGLNDYLQSVHDYVRDQSSMIKDSYRAQVAAVEQWQTVAKNLRVYVEKIRISELSPYDPGQKLELASESFARLLVEAEAGDLEAARQLSGAADAYLKQADSYYGRSDAYVSVFDEVAESLDRMGVEIGAANNDDTIERLNQAMLSEQQKLARYAERELQWAQEQAYILTGIEGALSGWPEKFGKIIDGLAGSMASAVTASKPERSEAGTASEVATGTYTPPDEQRSFYDRAVEGGVSHHVAKVWSGLPENAVKALDKALTSGGRIPAFAKGGDHSGGIRLVGERGPELEVTGPSRIFNADDTRKILAGDNAKPQVIVQTDPALITELQQLRAEVAQLRSEQQRANSKAEKQRDDQNRTSDALVRAAKAPVAVI